MKILYIVSVLPALSATFIDREIRVLAAAGFDVATVSRATPLPGEVSDEVRNYYCDTLYLDALNVFRKASANIRVLLSKPLQWLSILRLIFTEKEVKSPRDRLRLLAHFVQAGCVYDRYKGSAISHIHAHFLNAPTSIALFLSILTDIPFSFTEHASNIYVDPLMFRTKLRLCKKVVMISQYNKDFLLSKYGEELEDKIQIIHCGLDPHVYTPIRVKNDRHPVMLAVGRLVAMKGFYFLLQACRLLKDRGVAFNCIIIGDGEEKSTLLRKSIEFGVEDVVTFQGAVVQERVMQFLQEASVFVLPSIITDDGRRDGIPVALMEAMAMELPVISTNIVGIPELIEDGNEGLLVEQRNPSELAAALEFLLENEHVRKRMGRNGRQKIIDRFNINDVPGEFTRVLS